MSEMDQGNTVATEHRAVTPHSHLPWRFEGNEIYSEPDYSSVAMLLENGKLEANAAFIVRACNAFPEMLAALDLAEDVLSRSPHSTAIWPNGMHPQTGIDKIRAALSAAKGET